MPVPSFHREPPRVSVTATPVLDLAVDALVVPVFRGGIEAPGTDAVLDALGLTDVPRDASFRGDLGEVLHLAAPGLGAGQITLVGLGRLDALGETALRRAAGAALRPLAPRCARVATTLPLALPTAAAARAVAEGALLGAWRPVDLRSDPRPHAIEEVVLVVPSTLVDLDDELHRAHVHARAQYLARGLASLPSDRLGPDDLAAVAREVLDGTGVEVEVWDEDRLAEEGCGGLLAVGGGSARPPRLVRLRWSPADPIAHVALVGKGIVFDSGGISLKRPSALMDAMTADMAGAAAVLAVCSVLDELDVPVAVSAELCLAENLPSGTAQRPSDVLTTRSGRTVEVLDTDAEGRLVLADGLALAAEAEVDAIIDVATLTGAAIRAIGQRATALFGNDDDLLRQLLAAAEAAGDPMWHLPLWEDLRDNLDSDVADLDNLGRGDEAGATMGALFLREFVDGIPWAHLDVAGPAWQEQERHHEPKRGTGVPTRTLLRWLEGTRT